MHRFAMYAMFLLLLAGLACHKNPLKEPAPVSDQERELYQDGLSLFDAGQKEAAIQKYKEILAINPSNVAAMYELSYTHYSLEQYDKVLEVTRKALQYENELFTDLYILAANAHDKQGSSDEALNAVTKGLEYEPFASQLLFRAGEILHDMNKTDAAKGYYRRAFIANRYHGGSHLKLAEINRNDGQKVVSVLAYLHYLLLENPVTTEGTVHKQLVAACDLMKEIVNDRHTDENTGAVQVEQFNALVSKFLDKLLKSGLNVENSCDSEYYIAFFREFSEKQYTDVFTRLVYQGIDNEAAVWLSEHADRAQAFFEWYMGYHDFPESIYTNQEYSQIAEMYLSRDNSRDARLYSQYLVERAGSDYLYNLLHGKVLYRLESKEQARHYLDKSIELKENSEAYRYLGLLSIYDGNIENGRKFLKKSVSLDESNAESYFVLGQMAEYEKKYSEAIQYYENALKHIDNQAQVLLRIGQSYYARKEYEKARMTFEQAYEQGARDSGLLYNLGLLYFYNASHEKAWFYMRSARESDPGNYDITKKCIQILNRLGRHDEAARMREKLFSIYKTSNDSLITSREYYVSDKLNIDEHQLYVRSPFPDTTLPALYIFSLFKEHEQAESSIYCLPNRGNNTFIFTHENDSSTAQILAEIPGDTSYAGIIQTGKDLFAAAAN